MILFTVPYFIAVIATIIYTNKKIKKHDGYENDNNESEQQETTT